MICAELSVPGTKSGSAVDTVDYVSRYLYSTRNKSSLIFFRTRPTFRRYDDEPYDLLPGCFFLDTARLHV